MAEGGQSGDLPSLKDGSDADVEIKCTPCREDNIREEAVKYCPECHGRQKATRSHKLLDPHDVKHSPVVATKCLYHPDRDIEMYCSTHDMVYCTMCIATEHRMAEGGQSGDFPSQKDGSDADVEIKCTPCREDNIREEAVKYCPECHEYLCTTCTRHHGRQKATRSHKLLEPHDVKHSPVVATKCLYHPDRDIEMYCSTHDMVYCTMCIATEHRSCRGVGRIEDEQKSFQDAEVQSLLDETKNVYEKMKAITIKKQNNIDSLEEQRQAIQQGILEVEENIIEHIRKLKSELFESLEKDYTKLKVELESEISTATTLIIQDFEQTTKQLETVTDASPRQQFVQMKIIQRAVADANVLHQTSESNGTKALHFTENTELKNSMTSATGLGQVMIKVTERGQPNTCKPVEYKTKSVKEINVHMSNDRKACSISDVCQLEDGTVLLTGQNNNKVKRLDTNYMIKDHYDLDASPRGICGVGKSEVAVKMDNETIQFLSVGTTWSKTRCIDIVSSGYWGLTYCAGELWVSRSGGVNVYSTSGALIKSIDKDQNGKAIFKTNYISHMAAIDDNVIVTDQGDGAVCLNRDGTVRCALRDGRLNTTCGVCVTDDGTVFLCGHNVYNIVMFSTDGRCLGELVPVSAGLKKPISLCYDRKRHCLIVTCSSNNILIVELSD